MQTLAATVVLAPVIAGIFAYALYPAILWVITRGRRGNFIEAPRVWPTVTITVPVYNSVAGIESTLKKLLEVDYPRDRLQILVLSDASTDGTDDLVRTYAARGVELWRAPERRGKTAAENAAVALARGEIIVNVDATIGIPPDSLKPLVSAFADPTVGVASGRDVSVAAGQSAGGEANYVGFEMWLRDLETRAGSIVGASGCFFAIRKEVHATPLPPELSWDFASSLVARKLGFRSVSVSEAICIVPRTAQVRTELRRKSRTMARGLSTLFHFRELLNPFRYGLFAVMLISHKLLRWVPYLLAPLALAGLAFLAFASRPAAVLLLAVAVATAAGVAGIRSRGAHPWKPLVLAGFAVAAVSAGILAWYHASRGVRMATWNPTPRADASAA